LRKKIDWKLSKGVINPTQYLSFNFIKSWSFRENKKRKTKKQAHI
jgi:hypothetical protein